ncbi:hypothetical protein [Clostridium cellulovorans]|uniref:Uncharacterized protein n=1 Tax=Clostridium cellulovorans (strain ATCC 35296 / DSM 3052 / OCM 3 / 743B) TaxID=573061 RepID=D9SUF9_CLOC7|nr:hypothetical protein [Clostridium cellulovorans]ADL52914.1 hypothetical protein Clocel_3228 [Clostridium cellulovorans 743B]
MDLINERVEHINFGAGVINEIDGSKVWVDFKQEVGIKAFIYPDAFGKFLKAVNTTIQNNIMEELNIKQAEIERKRKEKELEAAELEKKKESTTVKKKSTTRVTKKKITS